MKRVLILDAAPLFKDFIKNKLIVEKIQVDNAESRRDGFAKMITTLPDLIIIDCEKNLFDAKLFLDQKMTNPNTKVIPVIICGPVIKKEEITELVQSGVVKYFHKPIRFDIFFEFVSHILKIPLMLDTTPCVLEVHVNNDLIFIEVARGLNRDKITLLKHKLTEIIDSIKLAEPKVIIMLTGLTLSFVDGCNLEALLDAVLSDKRIKATNVKVLSFDSFTQNLISGHKRYEGISVATNIQNVLSSVVNQTETTDMADFINDNILSSTDDISKGSMEMTYSPDIFMSESVQKLEKVPNEGIKPEINVAETLKIEGGSQDGDTSILNNIAIVDDDMAQLVFLKNAFREDFRVYPFNNGHDYIKATQKYHFDCTILDLNMPNLSGFEVLKILQSKKYIDPVIIYSVVTNKDSIFSCLKLGAKNFFAKPMKPEVLLKKVKEAMSSDI